MGKQLPPSIETKVVVLLARGDTRQQIFDHFKEENIPLGMSTINNIKKRNKNNLAMLKAKIIETETANALELKAKANDMLNTKLDEAKTDAEIVAQAALDYKNDKISIKEFERIQRTHRGVTVPELVSVSKEMHAQSKGDNDPDAKPLDQAALIKAIQEGDTVTMNQLIFKRNA